VYSGFFCDLLPAAQGSRQGILRACLQRKPLGGAKPPLADALTD
jgi:hypothetical protein